MNPYIQMGKSLNSRIYNFEAHFGIKDDNYVQPKLNICSGFSDEFMADWNEDENVPDSCRESLKHRHFNVGIMQEENSDQVNDSFDYDKSNRKKIVLHKSTKIKNSNWIGMNFRGDHIDRSK